MKTKTTSRAARRHALGLLWAAALGALAGAAPGAALAQEKGVLRIGYQKYGTLTLLKGRGTLDKRLAAQGIAVKWTEFPAGPVLLEGLNVGSIDFGTVGEAPPIFAQAAGANLIYVANEPPAPRGEAIVVPKTSPLKSVADLKGKRIALNKGSNVHYLLVRAIERAGLKYGDITTVYLPPADARAAFERGSVDAWVIWDPFLAAAQTSLGARVLTDGTGLVSNHQFYLAAKPYAQQHADVIAVVLDELAQVDAWGRAHMKEAGAVLAAQTGLDAATVDLAAQRYTYGIAPITPEVIAEQQRVADAFADLKLIPKRLRVADIVWQPGAAAIGK